MSTSLKGQYPLLYNTCRCLDKLWSIYPLSQNEYWAMGNWSNVVPFDGRLVLLRGSFKMLRPGSYWLSDILAPDHIDAGRGKWVRVLGFTHLLTIG